jgi:hypothetical protein
MVTEPRSERRRTVSPRLAAASISDVTPLLDIEYEVRRSDFVWMYLRSRAGIASLLPGAFFIVVGLTGGLADPASYPVGEVPGFIALGLAFLVLVPGYYVWGVAGMSGIKRVIGTRVRLRVEDNGITGWPLAANWEETSWTRLRKSWHLHGVLALPFGGVWTRRAWIPIPDRALSPEMRVKLGEVLATHYAKRGVPMATIAEGPFMARTEAEAKLVPSIVIPRSGLWKRLGYPPIQMADSWIQAPLHPLFRWDEIARVDTDPKRPHVLRLWTYAGGTHRSEVNEFPLLLGLKGYAMRPGDLEATIRRLFESSRSSPADSDQSARPAAVQGL